MMTSLTSLTVLVLAVLYAAAQPDQPLNCKTEVDLLFLMDHSDSISPEQFEVEKEFVQKMIEKFDISPSKVQVSAVLFGVEPFGEFCFDDYTTEAEVIQAVQAMECPECRKIKRTNIAAALKFARTQSLTDNCGVREESKRIVILLTDGRSHEKPGVLPREAELLKETGAQVISVGVGERIRFDKLEMIASNSSMVFDAGNFDKLLDVLDEVAGAACPPPPCTAPVDILFIMDISPSISDADFEKEKEFVHRMVDNFDVREDGVHVSVILYGREAYSKFCFETYQTQKEVLQVVDELECENCDRGSTKTGAALKLARTFSLTPECGARPGNEKIVIVLTDGRTQEEESFLRDQADQLKAIAQVISIGVGSIVEEELEIIASDRGMVFTAANFNVLLELLNSVINVTCEATPRIVRGNPEGFDEIMMEIYEEFPDDVDNDDFDNFEDY